MNKKKGFTIVEVVVAMSLLLMLTIMAATISITSIKNLEKNEQKIEAASVSLDIVEIYKSAEDEADTFDIIESVYNLENSIIELEKFKIGDIFYTIDINNKIIEIIAYNEKSEVLKETLYEKA